jgi:Gly-Xaa carboxypeptidase
MKPFTISSLTIAASVVSAYVAQNRLTPNTLAFGGKHQNNNPRCDLPRPVDPSGDGLACCYEVFSWDKSIDTMIDRLRSIVRLPTVCYDDMGGLDEDERWKPFSQVAGVLNSSYPNM